MVRPTRENVNNKSARRKRSPLRPVSESQNGGVKTIARAAGVSIGTVDRALHSRPGISPTTRARVLEKAKEIGYRPNFAARHLKIGLRLKVSVHLPEEIASFFGPLEEGIREVAEQLQPRLDVEFLSYPRMGRGEIESIESALEGSCDGIILVPGAPSEITPLLRKAKHRGIPVVCVASDLPGTGRLTAISTDPFTSGAIAAELFAHVRRDLREIVIVTGDLSTLDHSEKVRGFRSMLSNLQSPLQLVAVAETHDDYQEAYRKTRDLLHQYPRLHGIYVNTSNSLPVVRALEEERRLGVTSVITTDLFPELVPLIRGGKILATIYQRPRTQGRVAFEALHRYLVEGAQPLPSYKLVPHIIFRSNLDLFIEYLPSGLEQE